MIVQINDENFQEEVLDSKIPVLVDFYTTWCGPCKALAPVLEKLDSENLGVKICKLNIEESPDSASTYRVNSIPTIILFKEGQSCNRMVGLQSEDSLKDVIGRATLIQRFQAPVKNL